MNNVANSIVIVGDLFVASIGLIKQIGNELFWVAVVASFLMAIFTWIRLDSKVNDEQKDLKTQEMKLKNKKLELENKKLEIEIEKLK